MENYLTIQSCDDGNGLSGYLNNYIKKRMKFIQKSKEQSSVLFVIPSVITQ